MCPHLAHRRRWNHQPSGVARHSRQPSPLGSAVGSIAGFVIAMPFACRTGPDVRPDRLTLLTETAGRLVTGRLPDGSTLHRGDCDLRPTPRRVESTSPHHRGSNPW